MQMKDPIYCQDGEFNQMPSNAFGDGNRLYFKHLKDDAQQFAQSIEDNSVRGMITQECNAIKVLLLDKNNRYGNSALEPARVFSRANPVEQLLVRIDDKLSRIMNGSDDEDSVQDLIGYLILLRVARRLAK